jgi:hypothetical protein
MTDLAQSEAQGHHLQAPIAVVARGMLACHHDVQAVMVVNDDGKILAYERAVGGTNEILEEEEYPLLSFSPRLGMVFFLRLKRLSIGEEVRDRIESIFGLPYLPLTR